MAIVQRPLAAVIAAPDIPPPTSLQGQTVGITGVPSDTAVLHSNVAGSGGDPPRSGRSRSASTRCADLLAGRVAAATAFWSDEGVTLTRRRPGFHDFRVDDYGAPPYPELVVCATRSTLTHRDRTLAADLVQTLVDGYGFTVNHPQRSAADLERLVPGLDRSLVSAQLSALLPTFTGPGGHVGVLDPRTLHRWAAWEARFGIVSRPPDVAAAFDPSLAASAARFSG